MKKKKGKVLKIIGGTIGSIVALILVTILVLSCARNPMYKTFLKDAEETVKIPGLQEPYSPQGFDYVPEDDLYFFTGYMTNKTSSRIYVSTSDNQVGMVKMPDYNGKTFLGHVGGIAVHGDYVYVASSKKIFALSYNEVKENCFKKESEQSALSMKAFSVYNQSSFVFTNDQGLYVGEFYLKDKYDTDESHHFKTSDGSTNHAWVEFYPYMKGDGSDEEAATEFGLASLTPSKIYTVKQKVQGFAVDEKGQFILSTSWAIFHSYLTVYKAFDESQKEDRIVTINDKEIPVYDLNSKNQISITRMMPMSEDLDYENGKVYVNFESACKKYKAFNLYPTYYVMAYPLEKKAK